MATKEEVQVFLNDFKAKARTFYGGIIYYPRKKNTDTLLNLGITAEMREELIMDLQVEDYFRGTLKDIDPERPDYFEFGISYKTQEIYIKLSLGKFNKSPHCMSFHFPEQPMNYPFKENSHGNK